MNCASATKKKEEEKTSLSPPFGCLDAREREPSSLILFRQNFDANVRTTRERATRNENEATFWTRAVMRERERERVSF